MDIQLEQQAQSTDGIVLSKAFVRTEDGVSYVYKDDNGVLKKQIVKGKRECKRWCLCIGKRRLIHG